MIYHLSVIVNFKEYNLWISPPIFLFYYFFVQDEELYSQKEANISNDSVVQILAERCHTLEQANRRLQNEARAQQRQYEVCLDRVATQVVQALLSQKVKQEYLCLCIFI